MRVIVIASQKGGSGKTTLSGHLAVQAEAAGAGPVAIIDTDPQGSLAEWWNARQSTSPYFARATLDELEEDLTALAALGTKLAIIDTPPAITKAIQQVVHCADMVIVPIRPSPHDLRAAAATVELVEDIERPFVFVVNGATARAKITGDTAVTLSQYGTVAPVTLHQRVDFATSMIDGRTVMETAPESRSATEMTQLWDYVGIKLDKAVQRHGRALDTPGPGVPLAAGSEAPAPQATPRVPHIPLNTTAGRGEGRLRPHTTFGRRSYEEGRA
ncbi:ParA family protein [Roseospirillum parvum]|uniref:Chromosome partitioning protein n=1 Tax=Roseospirillum parvum TaxID=83401 RepID=A0A1G8ARK3_9PROT|nr:ParA family protein [Roseospirillum parvum]SDH23631.1 chromosome partitioning protein [Roseospirillum parvum]